MLRVLGIALLLIAAPVAKPKAPPAPVRPPPKVDVVVTATSPMAGWTVKLTNSGSVPVRIVADASLLELDVTPPTGAKVHCALPSAMLPMGDMERGLVLVAGRSYTEKFDPRLYCFSERETAALVAGAVVNASYGFGARSSAKAFIPLLSDGTDDPNAPGAARSIDATPLTLPADTAAVTAPSDPTNTDGIKLVPSSAARIDLGSTFERQVSVTIRNSGTLAVRSLFNTATVGFVLVTPDGSTVTCGAITAPTPIPELLTTLAPGSRTAVIIGLSNCPSEAFKKAGLYQLRPRVDTRRISPSPLSLFRGEVVGEVSLLRLQTSSTPRPPAQVDPP